jgi:hypothetical protein
MHPSARSMIKADRKSLETPIAPKIYTGRSIQDEENKGRRIRKERSVISFAPVTAGWVTLAVG